MNSKAVIRPAIVLLLISAVAAGLLGVVSEVTKAPIAAQAEKSLNEGMMAVMPEASTFEAVDAEFTGTITGIYKSDTNGFVLTTAPGGFGGAVNTMVGIDADGVITGLRVTGHSETPGLGAKSTEPAFYEQFTGQSGSVTVTKDGGQIVPITSSTITSRAVCAGAQEALDWVAANGGAY
ncbi:MAG: RnfABCDGE type electron transport complex subunit G [Anaerotignum sp.]|nr:RnfABCDGE type electron transport complex subunit G [Anaerotignum sp.]MBR5793174.1 RnfABCDGE type electron transport complex subunit G [Anaerotignum sp.]